MKRIGIRAAWRSGVRWERGGRGSEGPGGADDAEESRAAGSALNGSICGQQTQKEGRGFGSSPSGPSLEEAPPLGAVRVMSDP